mmetsp:Transcript_10983/g.20291  ORF Transcript_10983/g.20291 Transcript_10983/m.20291 type:complete len:97 (-) Transcript_10983:91-381(-)
MFHERRRKMKPNLLFLPWFAVLLRDGLTESNEPATLCNGLTVRPASRERPNRIPENQMTDEGKTSPAPRKQRSFTSSMLGGPTSHPTSSGHVLVTG